MVKPSSNGVMGKVKGSNGAIGKDNGANESEDQLNCMRQNQRVRW